MAIQGATRLRYTALIVPRTKCGIIRLSDIQPHDLEEIALRFEAMAAQIRLNKDGKFGGAFLLIPPPLAGSPVETLVLSDQNAGLFWSTIKGLVDAEFKRLQDLTARQY